MLNYYAHSICKCENIGFNIGKLEEILKSGYLLSRRRLGLNEDDALFNGMDYISLCDLSVNHNSHSAFNFYIEQGLSLLFDNGIKVIKPNYVSVYHYGLLAGEKMHDYGKKGRYSDFLDEVQVKDKLSLEYLRGLSLSLKITKSFDSENNIKAYLNIIYNLLEEYQYKVPLINLDDDREINMKK